jgi:hypothetical protein
MTSVVLCCGSVEERQPNKLPEVLEQHGSRAPIKELERDVGSWPWSLNRCVSARSGTIKIPDVVTELIVEGVVPP